MFLAAIVKPKILQASDLEFCQLSKAINITVL